MLCMFSYSAHVTDNQTMFWLYQSLVTNADCRVIQNIWSKIYVTSLIGLELDHPHIKTGPDFMICFILICNMSI